MTTPVAPSPRPQRFQPSYLMLWPIIILVSVFALYGLVSFVSYSLTTVPDCGAPSSSAITTGAVNATRCESHLLGSDGALMRTITTSLGIITMITIVLGTISFIIGFMRFTHQKTDKKS